MVNHTLVTTLRNARAYPSVSLLVPVGDGPHGRAQGPTRLRNLLRTASERLNADPRVRDARAVLVDLQRLADGVDFWRAPRGIALFAAPGMALQVDLPVNVRERVVIDETFATRDLVRALDRSIRYRVLVLGDATARLFEAVRGELTEVTSDGFPVQRSGPARGEQPFPVDRPRRERRSGRDEPTLRLFRQADAALARLEEREPLPLVLVGVERQLARFERLGRSERSIVAWCPGNHEASAAHELGALVWPVVAQRVEAARHRVALEHVQAAERNDRLATGLVECWHLASEGRGAHLVVEEGFHGPARLGPRPELLVTEAAAGPGAIDDAVDELVEAVQAKGGDVTFVPDGSLDDRGRVALALRY